MFGLIWFVLVIGVLDGIHADGESSKIVIVGAGAAGISAATKLLENGYNNILVLEAENRIGGRVHTVPFGKSTIDLGAQWCQGEAGNVVYELVKNDYEFGDTGFSLEKAHFYSSKGVLVDHDKCAKLVNLSDAITDDPTRMAGFDKSYGDFFEVNYEIGLQTEEFKDIDRELADQIKDLNEREINSLYATESWFDISAKLNAYEDAEGNQHLTWKGDGYKILFDFLTKKLPDPSKALPLDDKIHLNKEVTNIDYNSTEVIVTCADGSEYRADHVIVTVSLGFLKKNHLTLFTPQLPAKKANAIEHTGYGTLGKIFLEFEEPFWPIDPKNWSAYLLLWKQEDKDNITGTEREWLTNMAGFIRVDAQPNVISGLVSGKKIKQFEEISDDQLIDDCMWLLEKFLGRTLPRPINMQRNRWMTNKYFLGTYSSPTMDTQYHNVVVGKDLAETIYGKDNKPVLLMAGEATEENYSGYVHGAVGSGWRAANEILDYYRSRQQ